MSRAEKRRRAAALQIGASNALPSSSMQALRILMLVVILVLAYLLLVLRPQSKPVDLPPDLVEANAASPASPAASPVSVHSQYKEAMDRAHAAAKQMQAAHADADSF